MYSLLLYVYQLGIRQASFYNRKASLWVAGRNKWSIKLKALSQSNQNWIWFHCSSLGEYEDGRVIIKETKLRYPNHQILITFFSPSGYEAKKNQSDGDAIFYLPIDTSFNAKKFIDILMPKLAVFIRNDIWFNYLKALKNKQIPVVLLSFNMNEKSNFIKWPQHYFYKKAFACFNEIMVQNAQTAELVSQQFQIKNSIVVGNFRINSICETFNMAVLLENIKQFVTEDFCIVAGSSLLKEQQLFLKIYDQLKGNKIKWIIVPHEIDDAVIENALLKNKKMIRYSEMDNLNSAHDFLWIDNIGMLSKIYRYADIAFVGGGFARMGIHNILEPAVFGCHIAFGPNHRNYTEALELMELGGAEIVKNQFELKEYVLRFYNNRELLRLSKSKNSKYVLKRQGDILPIFRVFDKFLENRLE